MTASHDHDHDHEHEHGEEHEHHHHEHVDYGDAVRAFRAEKDAFFRSNPRSPLPEAERSGFPVRHIGQELADQRPVLPHPLQIFLGTSRQELEPRKGVLE